MKIKLFLPFVFTLAYAAEPPILEKALSGFQSHTAINFELQEELVKMMAEDQEARQVDILNMSAEQRQRISELRAQHNPRLKAIIAEHGWPGIRIAGIKGSHAMWLLVQHQDNDLEFQRKCLPLLKQAVDQQDDQSQNYAYLVDRVCRNENKPQIYGTQWDVKDGKLTLYRVEDVDHLNDRRLKAGLSSIEEYREHFKSMLGLSDKDLD